ncbi:BppU family phage baseplate upper protein [Bacillus cereus]|uniref:BppU family phage baseplate upper protein n=1 Tax=Bacillus cereus TaxID=1396 RepID=UPI002406EC55|nr:BppU family phage baseplate upper protein [Bacillus cereus]MDF9457029.1 BppU family phage baseplate upper protein [Bacillus cereus]MDF9642835.1 BppU family phage baseplate upper protein [Bacillus cereus]
MKTRLILDINKTQYAQLNSLVTGRVGDKASNTVDVYVVDGFIPYNLTGSDVYFECAKPDNTSVRDKNGITMIDAAKGHFEYTFPTQTFASVGKSKQAYFTVEKNSTVKATTQDFIIVSLPDALTNRIPSKTYISQLDQLIEELRNMALQDINSKAAQEAHDALVNAQQARDIAQNVQDQLNTVIIKGDSSVEAAQARMDEKGTIHTTLKQRIDSLGTRVGETPSDVNGAHLDEKGFTHSTLKGRIDRSVVDLKKENRNLVGNADFENPPFTVVRSSVYSFEHKVTSPSYQGRKSWKITTTNYETSTDSNKDFSIVIRDTQVKTDVLDISFMAYPSVSNKSILIRAAYSSGKLINLGPANQWNEIKFQLPLDAMTKQNDSLFFDFRSSFTLYMSDFKVSNVIDIPEGFPVSIKQVNQFLVEDVKKINNSKGAIERMIANGHSYWENVNSFVYGNLYTAYDLDITKVNGKNQIDCSSFANLMIHGIPYENTRYAGKTDNINSPFFFQNIDGYKFRFANRLGQYAFERGYSFKPKADLSDLQAGDVLFFSWTSRDHEGDVPADLRDNAFMKIDHVAVFLHKKNDSLWSTVQFDNNISTVYYDASNEYMSQCVLAARFPYANLESMYPEENIIIGGDEYKSVSNTSTIATYKLAKNLVKGRYYTVVLDGTIITDECYFVIQAAGKTIYSDSGRTSKYNGITYLRFPYLNDDVADSITLYVGAASGVTPNRAATINWVSMYEGYPRNITKYNKEKALPPVKFELNPALASDINSNLAPAFEFNIENNKMFLNFSIPFNTNKTGTLVLGNIGSKKPVNTHRISCNLVGPNNEPYNAIFQVKWDGEVSIIPYSSATVWKNGLANGFIYMT